MIQKWDKIIKISVIYIKAIQKYNNKDYEMGFKLKIDRKITYSFTMIKG